MSAFLFEDGSGKSAIANVDHVVYIREEQKPVEGEAPPPSTIFFANGDRVESRTPLRTLQDRMTFAKRR